MLKINKKVIAKLEKVYAINWFRLNKEKTYLIAATEKKGKCLLFASPDWHVSTVWDNPGGSMQVVPLCEYTNTVSLIAIQKFYPGFKSEKASIVYAEPVNNISNNWKVKEIIGLPFVHRIGVVKANNYPHIIASTICSGKKFEDDWSRPGSTWVCKIPLEPFSGRWSFKAILSGIRKNHGMYLNKNMGKDIIYISGTEGVFAIKIPDREYESWSYEHLIFSEVSEICLFDIDDDGRDEMVTIEPFHGNNLAIYKISDGKWHPVYKMLVNFGHVLWCGKIFGHCYILIGNRGGKKDLILLRIVKNSPIKMEKIIIDEGIGPTQLDVIRQSSNYFILSANNYKGEIAFYSLTK